MREIVDTIAAEVAQALAQRAAGKVVSRGPHRFAREVYALARPKEEQP